MKRLLAIALCLTLALCAASAFALETVTIAATPVPHVVILEFVAPFMEELGYELDIRTFNDYVLPNQVVESGEMDGNYFQHVAYLNTFNSENGTHLVTAIPVHFEPMGVFKGKCDSLDTLPDGAVIGVPNDTSNEYRALALLQEIGLITLDPEAGVTASKLDIIDNPKNLEIVEVEAAQLPRMLADFDLAVINGNYALDAGLSVLTDTVACESSESEGYDERVNYVCVKEGNENAPWVEALRECLSREETKAFIEETYAGSVVLALDAQQQQ